MIFVLVSFISPVLSVFHAWGLLLTPAVWLFSNNTTFGVESVTGQSFTVLSLWVFCLTTLSDNQWYKVSASDVALKMLLILSLSIFITKNATLFFVLFELSLVPIVYLILAKGERPERLVAVFYLTLYTVAGGALHLLALIMLEKAGGSLSFVLSLGTAKGMAWSNLILVAFFIKAPCYGFHLWLPKAHVEAPTLGSIILAAILLKFGLFGLLRYLRFVSFGGHFVTTWASIFMLGSAVAGMACTKQPDLKSLIAYSSVAHMTLGVAVCIFSHETAMNTAMVVGIAHGLSAAACFGWAGVVGSFFGSRNMYLLLGLRSGSSAIFKVFIVLLMVNNCMPPLLSFLGELMSMSIVWLKFGWVGITAPIFMNLGVFGAFVNMLIKCHPGTSKPMLVSTRDLFMLLFFLMPAILWLGSPTTLMMLAL